MKSKNKIQAVILDWAGTTIDYGSMAPLKVFDEIFKARGIYLEEDEIRAPMGLPKEDHIRELLKMKRATEAFCALYGRRPDESDVKSLYKEFEPELISVLPEYTTPIEGAVSAVVRLREAGVKIGSTTGYTKEMMDIIRPAAAKQGYSPDCTVTPDEVSCGRPAPYMIFKNMEKLNVYPPSSIIKAGDTLADIREGKNAGVITLGVIEGSSLLGLTKKEYASAGATKLEELTEAARDAFYLAGADYVLNNIAELPAFVEGIYDND